MILSLCVVMYIAEIFYVAAGQKLGNIETLHEWVSLDFDWPSEQAKTDAVTNKDFIPANNVITGVTWHKDELYVAVPRWRLGVPATLNKIVLRNGTSMLQPYPSWDMNGIDDCEQLQCVQGMEVDPIEEWMWIIDVGSRNIAEKGKRINKCPPKLLIYDMKANRIIRMYIFPKTVVSWERNFLSDIVVDRDGDFFAYISDTQDSAGGLGAIVVYNFKLNTAHRLTDPTMNHQSQGMIITINGQNTTSKIPVNGLALRPDKNTIYFCALAGYELFEVPTDQLRKTSPKSLQIQKVGKKLSQTDGMIFGQNNLYFGALSLNAIYKWEYSKDSEATGHMKLIEMKTETKVASDDDKMQWVDTFGFANDGWLYFTTNRLQLFMKNKLDFSGKSGANFRVMRVFVNEQSYFYQTSGDMQLTTTSGVLWLMFTTVWLYGF